MSSVNFATHVVQKTWMLHNNDMSLEWLQLRPWNGSQQTAFEKLCIQLLSRETVPAGSVFVPKSAPDAGIEGYWRLASGAEWGLQAKFFLAALEESQWKQLDKSVERSLDRHAQLTRYIVAIPQDRSDPRVPNQQWFADKWKERVQVWSEWAHQRKMSVSFEYWGETELLNRLTEEKNRGLVLFWFNKHRLSSEWMYARANETVRNVGPRYTPEINVELPVAFALEGLGRTLRFSDELVGFRTQLQQHMRKALRGRAIEIVPAEWSRVKTNLQEVADALGSHVDRTATASPFGVIASLARSGNELVWNCIEAIQKFEALKAADKGVDARNIDATFGNQVHWLRELAGVLHAVAEFLRSDAATCFEAKTLLLIGGAGTGKTHLFCDVALQRLREGLPTLLLLGTQFEYGEPLAQIPTRILGTELSRDDFLLALDAAGEAAGYPALLMIDALNEGEGHLLWMDFLRGMLEALGRYSHIAIAISVRDSYIDIVIPDGLDDSVLPEVTHFGFAGHELIATQTFFDYYGLKTPSMGHDDFARYVIGTNSGSFEWSKHRMNPKRRSRKKNRNWEDRFDLRVAQEWIMRRIIDLGWKTELHGEFDSRVPNRGREAHKPERIGKKYQWIAYHEFLGRVADNLEFSGETWSNRIERYDGPWQVGYVRDIDPSCPTQATNINSAARCWWQPLTYAWDADLNHEEWLQKTEDLPRFDSSFQVLDGSSQEWFVLESYFHFDQPELLALDKERETSLPERQIWAQVRSYLVHEKDFRRLTGWAHKQDFTNRWMPESHGAGRLFLGEHYWSPAFKYFEQPYYQREGWTREGGRGSLPVSVLVTSDPYSWEKGLDCSINGSVSLLLPCHAIVEGLSLTWNAVPGQYISGTSVVTQDPSALQDGPTALLVRKDYLLKFLREQKLRLLWTVLAEKNVYLDDREDWPGRLEISGSYGLDVDGIITGNLRTKLIAGRNLR
jgi:hypothetical protein